MPQEQKQVFLYAQAEISISRMNSDGPGDEDVNTKGGRRTVVTVKTDIPAPAAGGREIQVYLDYTISEGSKDYTHLSARAVATIQLDNGMTFNSLGAGFRQADYSESMGGQQHDWIDISTKSGIAGSVLSWCRIKIDGKGDDDRGNAQLIAHLSVPLVANVWIENPASGGQTSEGTGMLGPLTMSDVKGLPGAQVERLLDMIKGKHQTKVDVKILPSAGAAKYRVKDPV